MARMLTANDVEAGLVGGLFLSAGGSGRNAVAKNLGLGQMALEYGGVRLVALDELNSDDVVITATAVGAPGLPIGRSARAIPSTQRDASSKSYRSRRSA